MSWTEKELKRRAADSKRLAPSQSMASASDRMQALWNHFERANAALPSELQLVLDGGEATLSASEQATFTAWLKARDGSALGYATDGIRYVWPDAGTRRSNNFWIRWDAKKERYMVLQRIGNSAPVNIVSYAFDDAQVDYMIKRLVLGKRIRARAVRKRRLWLF